jgi:hypothetical protein
MNPEQHDINAARARQAMSMTNSSVPMASQPQRRHPNHGPGVPVPGIRPIPRPTPPHIKPVSRITGDGTKIPPLMDPANTYKNNRENQEGSTNKNEGDPLLSIQMTLVIVLFIILASSVFVIPQAYRFFWLVVVGLSALMMMGFKLYCCLHESSIDENTKPEDRKKLNDFAGAVLYGLFILFTVVMTCILLVLGWKVYGQVNSRSNLLSNTEPVTDTEQVIMETRLQNDMMNKKRKRSKKLRDMYM